MRVTVIIPTLASAGRKLTLERAVRSALNASGEDVTVSVCVNGSQWAEDTIDPFRDLPCVEIHWRETPSLPEAIAFGRSQVKTPFFAFLDDDDELLPHSIDIRLAEIERSGCDVVIGNGIRRFDSGGIKVLSQMSEVRADALSALFVQNWLPSCGGLFRTNGIGQHYFDDHHQYAEWTWLAYRLAMDGKTVAVVDQPTFVIHDTPASLSKSHEYRSAYLRLYERMLARHPPRQIARLLRARVRMSLHDIASESLSAGDGRRAAAFHVRSVLMPGGWRYLLFSRHLLSFVLKRWFRLDT